ncbi:serine hydroxymethyltransferase [Candidatus Shapirobacteria bacterium CG09_land_8_20_14_0_10_39_12]|uniref:Serine hydroxymethyltransferase n=2 Tax=Candidatus Shapironibacteriota TaxID=1752721 RepID=A0A2M8L6E2_9BACT|nr:MAG: serine hydroxymethyltransferase [Candidatus Shapirobacteria bacterium CG09_land_8_20_14_0_10_39_12]PJE69367.1 MAG: serine hydroxymethyltransferase [Candidatus Shapirobacteria bacterium CG10_big_fil_rev_8_21_14_0_10_38_14]
MNKKDPIFSLIKKEQKRQAKTLMLIPSENYASEAVRRAVGSCLSHKYAEGYPGKRYYQGNEIIDEIENLAINRAKKLFGVPHVNVQPHSGSPANAAVYFGLLEPGDKIMGMALSSGGHLTHGHPKITFSGKYFQSIQYSVDNNDLLDYNAISQLAKKHRPKIIVCGTTAYPRKIDFAKFSEIADDIDAFLMADIAHIVGLVIAGVHPSPVSYAHIVTTTTHKTLRGPRGAMIMVTKKGLAKDPDLAQKIDKAVFPGLQGGPHEHTIAGIAVALAEAATPAFKKYGKQIVKNAEVLATELTSGGFRLVTGGTDNHLMLIDLRKQAIGGKEAAVALEKAGLIVNANSIPHDPAPPMRPSGIRLGTPAVTTRGMKEPEMKKIAGRIREVLANPNDKQKLQAICQQVKKLCQKFPI